MKPIPVIRDDGETIIPAPPIRTRLQRAILKWTEKVQATQPDLVEAIMDAIHASLRNNMPTAEEIEEVIQNVNGKRSQARAVHALMLGKAMKAESS